MNSITFKVKDTNITEPVLKIFDYERLLNNNKASTLKRYNSSNSYIIKSTLKNKFDFLGSNSFIHTVLECFNKHHKLVIRPDDIWMSILNMFSIFVNNNSELLRNKFVDFSGKKGLLVTTQFRILDAPHDQLILEMKKQIQKNIIDPSITDWLVPSFTTTTDTDKVVFSSALMSSLQAYFEYDFITLCGLPEVTLLGSVEDWVDIKSRFNRVKEYDSNTNQMNQWCELLNPVLDKFIETAQGNPDIDWWNSIAKQQGRSGGPYLNGWITCFIIYDIEGKFMIQHHHQQSTQTILSINGIKINSPQPIQYSTPWLNIEISKIPNGYTSVPIKLKDIDGSQYDSELYGGHLTTNSKDKYTLQPSIDWCLIINKINNTQ